MSKVISASILNFYYTANQNEKKHEIFLQPSLLLFFFFYIAGNRVMKDYGKRRRENKTKTQEHGERKAYLAY